MHDLPELINSLKENICIVDYEKVNDENKGEIRAMACTLDPDRIPTHNKVGQNSATEQLVVWCTDRNAWRSVFVNTIQRWRVVTND